jgi:hypothetical protein
VQGRGVRDWDEQPAWLKIAVGVVVAGSIFPLWRSGLDEREARVPAPAYCSEFEVTAGYPYVAGTP